ncbi:MAG: FG-GAP-like repeat-containing protein [Flavobacteriaceae bacterium]
MKCKHKVLIFILILFITDTYAQFGGQQIISTEGVAPRAIYAADIDGDGDIDVLTASFVDDKIFWNENLDGLGTFGEQQLITNTVDSPRSIFAIDIDSDGDIDVLTTSFNNVNRVYWLENLDGLGSFSAAKIISDNAIGAVAVHAADLDNDGDIDVLSASVFDNKVAWYENLDGLGTFGVQQIITTSALSVSTVYAGDIDNDGDNDVVSASKTDDTVIWFENYGFGDFGAEQIISNTVNGVTSVYVIDIDNDGDMDVLSASYSNKISWHENLDGLGTFAAEQIISTLTDGAFSVHAADLDNDGDIDVLSASAVDNKIAWYENIDGQGNFGSQQLIDQENIDQGRDVFAADLDGDGDMDVIAASQNNHIVAWYENFTILEVKDNQLQTIKLSPNPTVNKVFIESNFIINAIQVYDILGRLVLEKNGNVKEFTVANLSKGLLVVKIITDQGYIVKKIVKQ